MLWMTMREVAARTGLSEQSVRKIFPITKFGRVLRIWEADVQKHSRKNVVDAALDIPELKQLFIDNNNAGAVIECLQPERDDDAPPCPVMTALLTSSMAAIRLEHPDWPPIGVDCVYPPVLEWLKQHVPQTGGGTKGDEMRALILAA